MLNIVFEKVSVMISRHFRTYGTLIRGIYFFNIIKSNFNYQMVHIFIIINETLKIMTIRKTGHIEEDDKCGARLVSGVDCGGFSHADLGHFLIGLRRL